MPPSASIAQTSPPPALTEMQWKTLVRHIQTQQCALVLGPSLTCGQDEKGQIVPLRRLLANEIAAEIEAQRNAKNGGAPGPSLPDKNDLALMCSLFRKEGNGLTSLTMLVQDFYKKNAQPSALLRELAKLPFQAIINTMPDDLMAAAFAQNGAFPDPRHYKIYEKQAEIALDPNRPLLYNLFGSVTDDRSLVLTQEDQMHFIDHILGADTGMPPAIRRLLTDGMTSYVFLGFDFENWYLRVLLHLLKLNKNAENVIGLHYTGSETQAPPLLTKVFFNSQFRLHFVDLLPEHFVSMFQNRVDEAKQSTASATAKTTRRSLVFLVEDEETSYRDELLKQLKPALEQYSFEVFELDLGDEIDAATVAAIDRADAIIPLISADFLYNEKLSKTWLDRAFERRAAGCLVQPILIKPCDWASCGWADKTRDLPKNGLPIKAAGNDRAAAWADVVADLKTLFQNMK